MEMRLYTFFSVSVVRIFPPMIFPLSIPLPLLFIFTFKVPDIAGKLLYVDYLDLGVVVHACNTNTWEAEAKGTLRV